MENKDIMTRALGAPVANDNNSLTISGKDTLLNDVLLIEKLTHFNRERIPERVVHAKGFGAYGCFEVTNDLSRFCKANLYSKVGKKTDIFIRFSTVGGGVGSADSARDPRGFAVKFYTDDGILDIVGNNTPVFFIRDPIKFPDFIHSQKKDPQTNLTNYDAFWDFLSLTPESIHQVTILFTDRGTPYSFRFMHGFGTNTFKWYNDCGDFYFVKYHFLTEQGIKNFTNDEAVEMAGINPDFSGEDLFDSIEKKNFPSWRVMVQIMTPEQAELYCFDPFDTTKVWFHKDFPLIPLGRLTLNRNPLNFFQETEQAAFCPANMVSGIAPSPDRMLQGRMLSYGDTQRYRLGVNFNNLPINSSKTCVTNYQRDGQMQTKNPNNVPNYFPNSFDNTKVCPKSSNPVYKETGIIERKPFELTALDFVQAGELYRRVLTAEEKTQLIHNICIHLQNAEKRIQYRQTALFYLADPDYGCRVATELNLNLNQVYKLSKMTQEERVAATNKNC